MANWPWRFGPRPPSLSENLFAVVKSATMVGPVGGLPPDTIPAIWERYTLGGCYWANPFSIWLQLDCSHSAATIMLTLPEECRLFKVQQQCWAEAHLVRLTRELAATGIDGSWWKLPISKRMREAEADHHWEWRKLIGLHRNQVVWESVAVQSADGALEGASLYRIDAKSQIEPGKGAVYIDRLAAAPRNRPWLMDPPEYRGVGTILMLAAVRHSYSLGLGGRVWLTSLPNNRTRRFYINRGMRVIFEDDDGMIDFELPSNQAERWLELEGYL